VCKQVKLVFLVITRELLVWRWSSKQPVVYADFTFIKNVGHPSLVIDLNENANLQTQEYADIRNNNFLWTADKLIWKNKR